MAQQHTGGPAPAGLWGSQGHWSGRSASPCRPERGSLLPPGPSVSRWPAGPLVPVGQRCLPTWNTAGPGTARGPPVSGCWGALSAPGSQGNQAGADMPSRLCSQMPSRFQRKPEGSCTSPHSCEMSENWRQDLKAVREDWCS